ncbi:MAG: GTP 3',8-cyclase MoaA [Planctomycetales bacterium]|nr:GTP 3',8-cyclase MoaA [Planctomycetales bacterium]
MIRDSKAPNVLPLVDGYGRRHSSLRISVTDRCNIRCFYCMPENVVFKPRDEILTFDEIERFVRAIVPAGITKLRLTGGEPLVRRDLHVLVERLSSVDGVTDLALTTNGILLADHAKALYDAGLQRLNISIDSLREETFQKITRRSGLDRVIAGIDAARKLPFHQIRLNAIAMRDITEPEIVPLAKFAFERAMELRFIEFMPLDADGNWETEKVLSGRETLHVLEREFGRAVPVSGNDPAQPAVDFTFANGGRVGFINSVTQPFCQSCNRLRITAEGQVRNCLFSTSEWDVRALLRSGASDEQIVELVRESVSAKKRGHGIDSDSFERPARAMYQIGG